MQSKSVLVPKIVISSKIGSGGWRQEAGRSFGKEAMTPATSERAALFENGSAQQLSAHVPNAAFKDATTKRGKGARMHGVRARGGELEEAAILNLLRRVPMYVSYIALLIPCGVCRVYCSGSC